MIEKLRQGSRRSTYVYRRKQKNTSKRWGEEVDKYETAGGFYYAAMFIPFYWRTPVGYVCGWPDACPGDRKGHGVWVDPLRPDPQHQERPSMPADITLTRDIVQLVFQSTLRRRGEEKPIDLWLVHPPSGVLCVLKILLYERVILCWQNKSTFWFKTIRFTYL